jgi:uncharacterized protein (DUF849 family)
MSSTPVIIECALNGGTPPSINPHVPRAHADIDREALECLDAGAAIIHSHVDIRLTGEASADAYVDSWKETLARRPDAILCPTTTMVEDVEEKWRHIGLLADRGVTMGVLDPGSVNLCSAGEDGMPAGRGFVYVNSYATIDHANELMRTHRLGPSIAIYEPGFLRLALAYERAGKLAQGAMLKLYFGGDYNWQSGRRVGSAFGLPPTRKALDAYLEMLEGSRLPWAVAVIGGDVVESGLARYALERGGHLRVGLEDHIGETHPTNLELTGRAAELCAEVGRPLADAATARAILDLPR